MNKDSTFSADCMLHTASMFVVLFTGESEKVVLPEIKFLGPETE